MSTGMLSLVLYPEADTAIADILTYTVEQYGLLQAEHYVNSIKASLAHLCAFPHTGRAHPLIAMDMRIYPKEKTYDYLPCCERRTACHYYPASSNEY